jgi:ATP-dependent 26S proteasome regulatory subunit
MKKKTIIIGSITIFLTIIANIGDIRCQENSNMINEQYQSKYMVRMTERVNEDNLNDDKNLAVEILGLIIKNKLLNMYQKIDSRELEDRVERSR